VVQTTLSRQDRDELTDVERPPARSGDLRVCAECRHTQLFAVQPRAVCTCRSSAMAGRNLFAGQPACAHLSPRLGAELVLTTYGLEKARLRGVSAPPRVP
jgi:hypothetical protein